VSGRGRHANWARSRGRSASAVGLDDQTGEASRAERRRQRMSKRLVICCDGTWNRPDQRDRGSGSPTNVAKVALGVARQDSRGDRQLLFYQAGVGTRRFERLRGGAFGVGLSRNVRDCYRFLVESYQPGDQLYLFGFSRGAFTARSTAGLVRNAGILRAENADRIEDAYRLYRARGSRAHPRGIEAQIFRRMYSHEESDIHFVGVWDTVGSLGIPLAPPFMNRRWGFHDTSLSSHVRHAYQALAIGEKRKPFRPTTWKQQDHAAEQKLEQVWFAGVHCDVGGGYQEPELAEIPLLWMVERARECGLAFEPDHFVSRAEGIEDERRRLGKDLAPDALGRIHQSYKGVYRLLGPRQRALAEPDRSALASSAVRRRRESADYLPAELDDYVAAGGPIASVKDAT